MHKETHIHTHVFVYVFTKTHTHTHYTHTHTHTAMSACMMRQGEYPEPVSVRGSFRHAGTKEPPERKRGNDSDLGTVCVGGEIDGAQKDRI